MDLRKIRNLLMISIGVFTLSLFACEADSTDLPDVEDCENYDYQDCNTVQPFEAKMIINFSVSSKIKSVPFVVYKGYVDDNNIYFQDTAWDANVEYLMPVDEYWSIMATYKVDGKTIKVIDGGSIKVHSANVCDSTCWSVKDLVLDAIIK